MDAVITSSSVATMTGDGPRYGLIKDGAVVIDKGHVAWVGPRTALPEEAAAVPVTDFGDALITPALIDCHTHIVFAGNRAGEFEARLEGASYEEVATAGGGIVSTMRAVRETSEETLLAESLPRVDALLAEGVGVLEIKSGYGLTIADELKMLRVARRIGEVRQVKVLTSWLAAHARPPEYDSNDRYIDEVVLPGLDEAVGGGLVDAVDGFCEGIAFSAEEMGRVFDHAASHGLPVKLHAEQLSDSGGTALVAHRKGLSADHLEHLNEADAAALGPAGTVAVLLPGACYTLRQSELPPVDLLRRYGARMAVATDCNPGSSPLTSLLLAMNMAATLFRLTPEEALAGTTRHAAHALGLQATHGTLAPGKAAELAVWAVQDPAELVYRIGFNPLIKRMAAGAWV
ncbi:imidazolonepropionase [Acuticoccus sp. MNP-M23]|uniref:imidazolonepropionase n=1 Tax=Acuticoccus sp. MNP-M23 TaxID=3072793 RepID=UPI0028163CC8|nr:imidazolonepropionase [Acuticoccus sp. MNP-M23]WMS44346.1 imidazolonepropionase [Acuticoccus sp. MNP-M23]